VSNNNSCCLGIELPLVRVEETKPPQPLSFTPPPLIQVTEPEITSEMIDEAEAVLDSSLKMSEDVAEDASVVRTYVGLFEQLSSMMTEENLKTNSAIEEHGDKEDMQEETRAEEAEESDCSHTSAVGGAIPSTQSCGGIECEVTDWGFDDPWSRDTHCKSVVDEQWMQMTELQRMNITANNNTEAPFKTKSCREFSPSPNEEEDALLPRIKSWFCAESNINDNNSSSNISHSRRRPVTSLASINMSNNNFNNNNADAESRFNSFVGANAGQLSLYQPSAIQAEIGRQPPLLPGLLPTSPKCRVGDGRAGTPAATEGGPMSTLSAEKAGIPWGAKKRRVEPKKKYINDQPYQTLKPSGHWTHGTQMQQPSNKQAQATRQFAFPYYLPKEQKCKARLEYRHKTLGQGVESSCKRPIERQRPKVDLNAVRCNCPGLYPAHPSQGPGNYWDEEDDDEAILAEMCPPDDLVECGQGIDNILPLEEWADEWEDGVENGDCTRGKLVPGTLDLFPWENPCLEQMLRRKARIQELRNKRWAEIDKARAEALRLKQESADEEGQATPEAVKAGKELERKAFNEYGQKNWSLLAWFTPTSWASGDGVDCADNVRDSKTCTVRTSKGANTCSPGLGSNSCSSNSNTTTKNNNNANNQINSTRTNFNKNNQSPPVDVSLKRPYPADRAEESNDTTLNDYEWDTVEESYEEYARRMNEMNKIRKINETRLRLQKMREMQIQKRKQKKKENEALAAKDKIVNESSGFSFFGLFGGGNSNGNNDMDSDKDDTEVRLTALEETVALVAADNDNNNAANRCFKPCPPCPQEDCEPLPFECPCNDLHCPKKLKANKQNVVPATKGLSMEIGNLEVSVDITEDLVVEGIDIAVRKPPPDLNMGCPCGDEECKKKKCSPPPPPKYSVCQKRNGPMALQEACPAESQDEADICDRDQETSDCPCTDESCPKKGGKQGFVFKYPADDKLKFSKDGCPLQQQMQCIVTQIGEKEPTVVCKPIGRVPFHCESVPPCPCPEWAALEKNSSDGPGNAWGEEIGDEGFNCSKQQVSKELKTKDCGGHQAEGGVTNDDEEWDFWDGPCGGGEVVKSEPASPAEVTQCQEFMASRHHHTDNTAAAMEAALEAFEWDKIKKEKEKDQAETRKRKIEEMREQGMSEDEIFDVFCRSHIPGPCDISGEYPPQEGCGEIPVGCPCPDPQCPRRAPFDYQMRDLNLANIKNPADRQKAEQYLASDAFKTMDCELRQPTYKDVNKTYPKRDKSKCPCPECVGEDAKAWAEVEKMKVGPPPECPCTDPKCPKKPKKKEEKVEPKVEPKVEEDKGPCAMKTYYPKQSGCLEVLRCDLIRNVCDQDRGPCDPKSNELPQERYRCHSCSILHPMPAQSACPDYDCNDCELVCHKCGCEPKKCEDCTKKKAEHAAAAAKKKKEKEKAPCPPCAISGPMPPQSDCKELHPCNPNHPCMCNPNTGEPIYAERCGPCDTRNHKIYPYQTKCDNAEAEPAPASAAECPPKGGMKLVDDPLPPKSNGLPQEPKLSLVEEPEKACKKKKSKENKVSEENKSANGDQELELEPLDETEAVEKEEVVMEQELLKEAMKELQETEPFELSNQLTVANKSANQEILTEDEDAAKIQEPVLEREPVVEEVIQEPVLELIKKIEEIAEVEVKADSTLQENIVVEDSTEVPRQVECEELDRVTELKEVEAKEVETKDVETKDVETKEVEAMEIEVRDVEVKEVETLKVEAMEVEAREVEIKEAWPMKDEGQNKESLVEFEVSQPVSIQVVEDEKIPSLVPATATFKVEVQMEDLELQDEELIALQKELEEMQKLKEKEEAEARRKQKREELLKVLEALREEVRAAKEAENVKVEDKEVKDAQPLQPQDSLEDSCNKSCSFMGMEMAFLPNWMRPKAKCHDFARNLSDDEKSSKPDLDLSDLPSFDLGFGDIRELLHAERERGIYHRTQWKN